MWRSVGRWVASALTGAPENSSDMFVHSTTERFAQIFGGADSPRQQRLLAVAAEQLQQAAEARAEVVEVTRRGLTRLSLPGGAAFAAVTRLDLSYNRLSELPDGLCMPQLRELVLRGNHLQAADKIAGVLAQTPALTALDLSHNLLRSVDALPFERLPNLIRLSTRHNPLVTLPDALTKLSLLTHLDVGEAVLYSLPAEFGQLTALQALRADYNELSELPPSFGALKALRVLLLDHNRLTTIPQVILECGGLLRLQIGGNMSTSLPCGISRLSQLRILHVSPSNVPHFPEELCQLPALQFLSFSGTKCDQLPEAISQLQCLATLEVRWNCLSELPCSFGALTPSLTKLDASGNIFAAVPPCLTQLTNLQALNLGDNSPRLANADIAQLQQSLPQLQWLYCDAGLLACSANAGAPGGAAVGSDNEASWQFPPSPVVGDNLLLPDGATSLSPHALVDKVMGLVLGAAIGDAIGLATEFMTQAQAHFQYGGGPIDFSDFVRCRHRNRWILGDWTDDTDQMVLILQQLLETGGDVDAKKFALELLRWAREGFSELGDGGGMGIGATVSSVLMHKDYLIAPHQANGAIMRTGVLGVPFFYRTAKVVANTVEIAKVCRLMRPC
eukprot:TRINITY_DN918_c0_g1_i10.p2 TRINITY_DN918_c0_g1~~TRINITY_DN918_c0_g1_i10.p2  ORF type:complete len:617 (+),score=123.79 TRINITY_DN918_c0_g1_i10:3185-5035(+)